MKYDFKTLSEFCQEQGIVLCEDYTNIALTRETMIKGKCKTENCANLFTKGFRALLKPNGYCSDCAKIVGKEKYKQTCLENMVLSIVHNQRKYKIKLKKQC